MKKTICVYGASSDAIDACYKEAAWELGKKLAEASYGIVFGGGATGLMGAAARGLRSVCTEKSSETVPLIGVAPRFFDKPGVLYSDCSEMIWTDTMRERKQIMEDRAQAFVVLPGGIGTFEEFFEILTLKQLKRHNKPILLYNVNGYYEPVKHLLSHAVEEGFLAEFQLKLCSFAENPEEILEKLEEMLENSNGV